MKSMHKAGLTVGAVVIAAALFTSESLSGQQGGPPSPSATAGQGPGAGRGQGRGGQAPGGPGGPGGRGAVQQNLPASPRSEEHTSELQSRLHLVCRLLLEKK